MEIGKIIKECRTKKNMTQEELANILFVSRQLISKWENNKSYPDLNQLIQLSDYFDLSLDELMRGDKKMIKKKDAQVKTIEKGKRIIIIGGIVVLVALYFGILTIQKNDLYKNVKNENWTDGDLAGQGLYMDSEFKLKKELRPIEKQTISYEFEKIFNKELDVERPFLEPFLNEVDEKWKEINN